MSTQVLLIGGGLFQDGLSRILKTHQDDITVIGAAETWEQAESLLKTLQPHALIADYQCADVIVADMERISFDNDQLSKVLFIIQDENKMILYRRQQYVDATVQQLIEAL